MVQFSSCYIVSKAGNIKFLIGAITRAAGIAASEEASASAAVLWDEWMTDHSGIRARSSIIIIVT